MNTITLRATTSEVSPQAVENEYKKCKDTRLKERLLAILHSFRGIPPRQIALIVRRSVKTVRTWIDRFNAHGLEGLKLRPIPGRPSYLTPEQQQDLKAKILAGPRANGIRTNNWTCKCVRRFIQKEYRITYSISGVQRLLHRLGFVLLQPSFRYRKASPEEQAHFLEELEKELKELEPDWLILALDEAKMQLHPTLQRCWTLKGVPVEIPTWGTHPKQYLYVALDPFDGQLSYRTFAKANSQYFCQFLSHLLRRWPERRLYLILDNATYHTSKFTTDFLEEHSDRIKVKFFPKYSPKLNPVEQLFRWVRTVITHNHFFETLQEFFTEIRYFMNRVRNSPKQLLKRCPLKVEIL